MKKFSFLIVFTAGIVLTCIISWKTNENETTVKQSPENRPVIALRKIKLKDGVSANTFENFATKIANDEYGKLPGVSFYYGKGERGDEPNSYVFFMEFDSKSTRDFYAPTDESKTSVEARKFVDEYFSKYSPEFDKLAIINTPAGGKGFVDYIILK